VLLIFIVDHVLLSFYHHRLWSTIPPGTYFAEYGQVLNCNVGGVISFQGNLFHGGHPITSGIRYILVAFLYSHKEEEEKEGGEDEEEKEKEKVKKYEM